MASDSLHQQIVTMKQTLLDQGIIDEKFTELENLICYDKCKFDEYVIEGYAMETKEKLAKIEEYMDKTPIDYTALEKLLRDLEIFFQFMGAKKMRTEASVTKECCHQGNMEGAKAGLERLKGENETFKAQIASYFQLVKQSRFPENFNHPK